MKKDGHLIFDEYDVSLALQKKTRVKLINYLADLIDDEYESNASQTEIGWICQATITLFPCLEDDQGGIVSLTCQKLFFRFDSLTI